MVRRADPTCCASNLISNLRQPVLGGGAVQRKRKVVRHDASQQHVYVGDRQRPTATIGGGTRNCSRAGGTHGQLLAVEATNASPAGSDRFHGQHRSDDPHSSLDRLLLVFKRSVNPRDVGAGPAHVEGDHLRKAGLTGDMSTADDPACGPAEDSVLCGRIFGGNQPTGAGHQPQTSFGHHPPEGSYVFPDHTVQVSVGDCGVATWHDPLQPGETRRHRHIRKSNRLGDPGNDFFMPWIYVGMKKTDRDRFGAAFPQARQLSADHVRIGSTKNHAGRVQPLVNFNHRVCQLFPFADMELEKGWPVLVADLENVAKYPGGQQRNVSAGAFQERVGSACGTEANRDGPDRFAQR